LKSTCPTKVSSPNLRRDQAVDSDGLRYDAMESALRPSLPTATRSVPLNRTFFAVDRGPNPWPLDQHDRAKHHHFDPRKQTPGGRHQIGTPAGFKSESVAGFLLECLAGFLGIRSKVEIVEEVCALGSRFVRSALEDREQIYVPDAIGA
jgi:hypothetical protein